MERGEGRKMEAGAWERGGWRLKLSGICRPTATWERQWRGTLFCVHAAVATIAATLWHHLGLPRGPIGIINSRSYCGAAPGSLQCTAVSIQQLTPRVSQVDVTLVERLLGYAPAASPGEVDFAAVFRGRQIKEAV